MLSQHDTSNLLIFFQLKRIGKGKIDLSCRKEFRVFSCSAGKIWEKGSVMLAILGVEDETSHAVCPWTPLTKCVEVLCWVLSWFIHNYIRFNKKSRTYGTFEISEMALVCHRSMCYKLSVLLPNRVLLPFSSWGSPSNGPPPVAPPPPTSFPQCSSFSLHFLLLVRTLGKKTLGTRRKGRKGNSYVRTILRMGTCPLPKDPPHVAYILVRINSQPKAKNINKKGGCWGGCTRGGHYFLSWLVQGVTHDTFSSQASSFWSTFSAFDWKDAPSSRVSSPINNFVTLTAIAHLR